MFLPLLAVLAAGQSIAARYDKFEYRIPMRDGVRLYTAVFVPKNRAPGPILLERTPYGSGPYGPNRFPDGFGGSKKFEEAGYIFATQDVRGRFMSEGRFREIRPQMIYKLKPQDIDESTDAYDTIAWLVKNVPRNNGRVGIWGISYPGFYASAATIDSHPALKAASPQAPVSEWFLGDDVHHNGAFFLQDNFDFYFWFGIDEGKPVEEYKQMEGFGPRPDAYQFFLDLGAAENAEKFYKGRVPFWQEICEHDTMDDFWQARSLPPRLRNVKCAVLTVGGWFDAEDLYGTLDTYRKLDAQNPGLKHWLVMGPWGHGGWSWGDGRRFALYDNGQDVGSFYREQIEFPFFDAFLRGDGSFSRPEATAFVTGSNQWKTFAQWPPAGRQARKFFLGPNKALVSQLPAGVAGTPYDEYASDPASPVPYMAGRLGYRNAAYMGSDQRFAAERSDVLTYTGPVLDKDLTIAGPIHAELFASVTGTDADFVVKVIDVLPGGVQRLVRAEVMRSKFRDSWSNPRPLDPGKVERVAYTLPDTFHTFLKGHRMMVQVQSSWFPLVDRNTHRFQNLYRAKPEDYQKATIRLYRQPSQASSITVGVLP